MYHFLYCPHLLCQAESRVCYYAPQQEGAGGLPTAQPPHLTRSSIASERSPPGPHLIQLPYQTSKNMQQLSAISILQGQCWSSHHLVSSHPMQRPYDTYPVLVHPKASTKSGMVAQHSRSARTTCASEENIGGQQPRCCCHACPASRPDERASQATQTSVCTLPTNLICIIRCPP